MIRALVLLARAIGTGVVTAHLAGLLVFALVVAVEAAEEPLPVLIETLAARLPALWEQSAAVLGCVGAAFATLRLRRRGVVLALGTLGFDPRVLLIVGAVTAGVGGAFAARGAEAPAAAPGAWERGEGGWIRDGMGYPDVSGGVVRVAPREGSSLAAAVSNAAAAGACGAALGLWAGATPTLLLAAVLLVVDVVARGLTERAAVPAWGVGAPALAAMIVAVLLLAQAPLFPRRWG